MSFKQNGRNLKGLMLDSLPLKQAGRILLPVVRPQNRKVVRVRADDEEVKPMKQKLRWMKLKDLTKI